MGGISSGTHVLLFDPFELELRTGELRKAGAALKLQMQPFKVLALLTTRAGQVVTREDIKRQVWRSGTFVDFEGGINSCIKQIRTALGETAWKPRYIETLPRRGYRFIAKVKGVHRPYRTNEVGPLANFRASDRQVGKIALAVLPFGNLSGNPDEDYFAEGITDALITSLSKISALRVISRTSAMRYKDTSRSLPQIARELNVDGVVTGTVLRSGGRVRIAAQLIDGATDENQWAESYERDLRDILALQNDVARTIAREIRVKLTPQEQEHLSNVRFVSPEGYEAYLKGRYYQNKRTEAGLMRSIDCFECSIREDPYNPLAHVGLADSYVVLGYSGPLPPQVAYPKAKAAATKGLELDAALADAHASLAYSRMFSDWEWTAAEKGFRRALELNPCSVTAHQWYADFLTAMGRYSEAIDEIKQARELDPLCLMVNTDAAWVFFHARQYDQALKQYCQVLEMDQTFAPAHLGLGLCHEEMTMFSRAIKDFHEAVTFSQGTPMAVAALGHAFAKSGKKGKAQECLSKLRDLSKRRYVSAYDMGIVLLGLGDHEQTLLWLEKAYSERSAYLIYFNVDPRFDKLRADPRTRDLLQRLGLAEKSSSRCLETLRL